MSLLTFSDFIQVHIMNQFPRNSYRQLIVRRVAHSTEEGWKGAVRGEKVWQVFSVQLYVAFCTIMAWLIPFSMACVTRLYRECHQNDSFRFQWLVSTDCNWNVTRMTHFVLICWCRQIVMGMWPEWWFIPFSMVGVTRLGMSPEKLILLSMVGDDNQWERNESLWWHSHYNILTKTIENEMSRSGAIPITMWW